MAQLKAQQAWEALRVATEPATASGTASDGILAAACEVATHAYTNRILCVEHEPWLTIIAKHCVDKDSYDGYRAGARARGRNLEQDIATEKARADNLQAELEAAQEELLKAQLKVKFYREDRDALLAKLIKPTNDEW